MPDDAKSKEPRVAIPEDQWDMPVSLTERGQLVTLREFSRPDANPIPFRILNEQQRSSIAAKRIEMQPNYEMASIGAGVIRQERALKEIRSHTELGRSLTDIEMRVIKYLIDELSKKRD